MSTHTFTVNVPNPSAKAVAVQLRLERVKAAALGKYGLDIPQGEAKVTNAVLSLDPCAHEGNDKLRLKLEPFGSANVHVAITTVNPLVRKGGVSAFNLVDERGGKVAGGVMLVCTEGAGKPYPGKVIPVKTPCPVVFATKPYPTDFGSDPSKDPGAKSMPLGTAVQFVAPITNPTKHRLEDVQVHLEHLGTCDADFDPMTWNVGGLDPGEVFYATWTVHTSGWMTGISNASVVVRSRRTNSVRLNGVVKIGGGQKSSR